MLKRTLMLCLIAGACFTAGAASGVKLNLWPLNPADSVINPHGSSSDKYSYKALTPNTRVRGTFRHKLQATGKLKGKAKYEMKLNIDNIPCKNFDQIGFICGGRGLDFELVVETDKGVCKGKGASRNWYGDCIIADLKGAKVIKSAKAVIEVQRAGSGNWEVTPRFFFLRNSAAFKQYVDYYKQRANVDWDYYLKSKTPSYTPHIFCTPELFDKLRKYCMANPKIKANLIRMANYYKSAKKSNPWEVVVDMLEKDYAGFMMNSYMVDLRTGAANASLVAAILKDRELAQVAARYALAMANMDNWNDLHYTASFGTKAWKVFRDADAAVCLAMAWDFVDVFNAYGRDYILRALEEKGYNAITFSLWDRSYALKSNQGMIFLRGKIIPLVIFAKYWDGVEPYIDIVKHEMDKCISYLFAADGGNKESTGYMGYAMAVSTTCYQTYANAMKKPLSDVVPEVIAKSGDFAEAIYSTSKDPGRNQVIFGYSGHLKMSASIAAFMAAAAPKSAWLYFIPKEIDLGKRFNPGTLLTQWQLIETAGLDPKKRPKLRPFVHVKSNAIVSSLREYENEKVKIFHAGYNGFGGKRGNDFGFFVIEYAGDVYADSFVSWGKGTPRFRIPEWRNVLVPTGVKGIPEQIHPKKGGSITNLNGSGNATSFKCTDSNLEKVWESRYFEKWSRTIDSPTPDKITITDEYKLGSEPTGADFIWVTTLPVELKGNKIIITGKYGSKCEISWNSPCKASVDSAKAGLIAAAMCMKASDKLNRIKIHREGKSGTIIVNVKLIAPKK